MVQSATDKIIDRTVNLFFSKEFLSLFSIVVVAFILRLIAAINLGVQADDMHFVTHAINFLSAGRLEAYDQSSGLWFVLTSIFYNLFGKTQIASRLAPLLFGTLTAIPTFLLAKQLFDKKTAIFAAALIAFATFHIKNTTAEMDATALFFTIAGIFFFIYALKNDKTQLFALSGLAFGLAVYTKVYPVFFAFSLAIYYFYFQISNNRFTVKKTLRHGLVFALIFAIFVIPTLTHNYLLYQSKGLVDLQFTRTLGIAKDKTAQFYSFDPIFNEKNDWAGLFTGNTKHDPSGTPLIITPFKFIWNTSPLILILGFLGLFTLAISARNKGSERDALVLILLLILPALVFLASVILLPKHFLFIELFLVFPAAFFVNKISTKYSSYKIAKPLIIIGILLLWSVYFLGRYAPGAPVHFYSTSYVDQIIDFKQANIPKNALMVVDSRFYRGQINWFSQDRVYIESLELASVANQLAESTTNQTVVPIDVYYVECTVTDCGWGTVQSQPEFNASATSIGQTLKNNMALSTKIFTAEPHKSYYPLISSKPSNPSVEIYHGTLTLDPRIISYAQRPKNWFLYYIGYPQPAEEFDAYDPQTDLQNLLNKTAHAVVYLSIILAALLPILLIIIAIRDF